MVPKFDTRPALCEAPSAIAVRRRLGIEPAQGGAGRRGADGAEDAGGMPALLVVLVRVAALQVGPHLVARHVGGRHLRPAGLERLRLGQDRRHQHRARMAAQRHVVVVERMRRRAVDPGRLGRRDAPADEVEAGIARRRRQRLLSSLGGSSMLPAIMVPTQSAKPVCTTLSASVGMAARRSSETKSPSERVSGSDMGSPPGVARLLRAARFLCRA